MIDPQLESAFLEWLRGEAIGVLTEDDLNRGAKLTKLIEVPGDPEFAGQALSYALQVSFEDLESARVWGAGRLPMVIERYTTRFGTERALVFATILEEVKI